MEHNEKAATLKERAKEELRIFWIITLYLWLFLGSFTVYRRLITDETGIPYLHYGIALVEALIIAKVILIGHMFAFSRRFEDRMLVIPMIYKSILFGLLVVLFGIVEHMIEGWFHHEGVFGGLRKISDQGVYELGARAVMIIVALVPFFAFAEIGRVLGARRLTAMFFSKPEATEEATRPSP
jgi:hypothetical protein